jgi:predicted DNA-binding transcriptional regulator YafY
MRRADRLFRIVQLLRGGRLKTARTLAERLEVSERTIYRDVRDLQLSGTPIDGEAGVGYRLLPEFDLPPLMFTREELTALVLGARLVKACGGAESVRAADQALGRIEAILPANLRDRLDKILLFAPDFYVPQLLRERLDLLHEACVAPHPIAFHYVREDGTPSQREVRPLALYRWTASWTLATWCDLRKDFRVFRIDRMEGLRVLPATFEHRPGQMLEDFLKTVVREEGPKLPA